MQQAAVIQAQASCFWLFLELHESYSVLGITWIPIGRFHPADRLYALLSPWRVAFGIHTISTFKVGIKCYGHTELTDACHSLTLLGNTHPNFINFQFNAKP